MCACASLLGYSVALQPCLTKAYIQNLFAEPAAAVPHTEIVGHGDYFRFGMRDSLAIEASFLQVISHNFTLIS